MLYSPKPMHIPDGFLSIAVAAVLWAVSIVAVAYALRRVGRDLGERQVPLMGVLAACIFAGQMLNFAVTGGTSGHLLGAAIATILLGPWASVLVLTCVVSVQALLFQDGGILALGANILNMAVVGILTAYVIMRLGSRLAGRSRGARLAVTFVAGWASVLLASLACAVELGLSGSADWGVVLTAMGSVHALIGIGEGLVTTAVVAFLLGVRPDMVNLRPARA